MTKFEVIGRSHSTKLLDGLGDDGAIAAAGIEVLGKESGTQELDDSTESLTSA